MIMHECKTLDVNVNTRKQSRIKRLRETLVENGLKRYINVA